jgi:GNAT superfamily N-acetyltransferase
MRVRVMTEQDAGAVAALSGQLGYPAAPERIAARFREVAADPDAGVFVAATPDGAVAGWIHVCGRRSLESEPHAEIAGLVVDAARRRQGIGRRLVDAAGGWARRHGYSNLKVRSNVTRDVAHDFYGGLGFTRIKSQHVYTRVVDAGR